MLQPLALDASKFSVPTGLTGHIESALARGLPEFTPALVPHDGTFVIVGSGPSLAHFAEDLKAERAKGRPICAIKGAHDWLVDNGIEPDLFVSLEPRDRRNNVQRESPKTTYLLASRCSPAMFDHLKGRRVVLWHAGSDAEENACLEANNKLAIVGGPTSGLRAVTLGYYMGFKRFVLYGMDSCNAADGITKRVDGSLTGQTTDVIVNGRRFVCNVAMAHQAGCFQNTYVLMPDIEIEAKGDGLLAAIIDERNRLKSLREAA